MTTAGQGERSLRPLDREAHEMLGLVAVAQDKVSRARALIVRRLTDIALMPENQLCPQERQLVDRMLTQLVAHIELDLRARLAARLAGRSDAPPETVVALAYDVISVARPLLEKSAALRDADLVNIISASGPDHAIAASKRAQLSEAVTDALVATCNPQALLNIARNKDALFTSDGFERIVLMSETNAELREPLLARSDIAPTLAHTMFWWVSAKLRMDIVNRFTADRRMLRAALDDAIDDGMVAFSSDPATLRALNFMAPQRRFGPTVGEDLLAAARSKDLRKLVVILGKLADLEPATAAHIVADSGGEALAVACKALGVLRAEFLQLALLVGAHHDTSPRSAEEVSRLTGLFDMVATDKADVVLRYWDTNERKPAPPPQSSQSAQVAA